VPDTSIGISKSDEKCGNHRLKIDDGLCSLVCRNKRKSMGQRDSAQPRAIFGQPDTDQKSKGVIREMDKLCS
jgi:hypothetical protein